MEFRALKQNQNHLTILRGPDAKNDDTSKYIDSLADASIRLPHSIELAQKMIQGHELDLLFYPDIGMSPYTYTLALERLAPVQVTSWGHPNTTGLKTIDYFLSSELIEPNHCKDLYTERLIRFRKLPCVYTMPQIDHIKSNRSKFKLPKVSCLIVSRRVFSNSILNMMRYLRR